MDLLEALILGITQGITEWLPLSSGGLNALIGILFFDFDFKEALSLALWLHLGTLLAAVIYFRRDLLSIDKKLLKFLAYSTIATFIIGGPMVLFLLDGINFNGGLIAVIIGFLLILTGLIQWFSKKKISRKEHKLDAWLVGAVQGLAVLPGLSRSGLTIAAFLFRNYKPSQALRLSFLMSIPVVFIGQILLGIKDGFYFDANALIAVFFAFIFGLITIKLFINIARKINFYYFVIILGIIFIIGGLLI